MEIPLADKKCVDLNEVLDELSQDADISFRIQEAINRRQTFETYDEQQIHDNIEQRSWPWECVSW